MESFGLGLALLRLLLTSPILVHTLISMIEKKIERLKAFALGRGISADRVLSPFDYFLLKINCAPIVFWAFYEVMMLFGVLSVIAYIVGVSIGWNTASSGKFLQYGISGCGIGLLIFWVFLYPIKRKLNLRSWNEF